MRCGIEGCTSKVDKDGVPLDGKCRAPLMDCMRPDGKRQSLEALSDPDPDAPSVGDAGQFPKESVRWRFENREIRIVRRFLGVSESEARYALDQSGWSSAQAIDYLRRKTKIT